MRQKQAESSLESSNQASPLMRKKPLRQHDSYLHRLSVSSSAALWQDIPDVRSSGILASMTLDQQKLQEVKFELVSSEASYLRSLDVAVDHFQHSAELNGVLSNQDKQWLFSRLQEVRDISSNFLNDLEERLEDDILNFSICDVILGHCPELRKVYLPYVTNQAYQEQTFQRLQSGVPQFQQVLEKLESSPVCQRLSLKSFLILPFQRITRLKLLVQNILKRTLPGSKEEQQTSQALNALDKIIKDCNESVRKMKSTEELIHLSKKIEFACKIFPFISQSRRLVKHGELMDLEHGTSVRRKMTAPCMIYLHLFNDCILLSKKKEGGRFVVFDHAQFSKIRVEKCELKLYGPQKNIFRLFLLQNNAGKQVVFLFRAQTQSEKLRWISALSEKKEVELLECQDCPQVQCLKAYKAQENDELTLEKADLLMVTQQSNDDWLEGVRLSDGERGWFPLANVESISNRHVRLRNIKEKQRITKATANFQKISGK
ncbi:rho guanine nucleotide exchange factor 5 [Latimeria chalumnae]|uniref:rho guanine nucleotide exchange factor 5 n=1 Tax=Latimeria chalumnae TaxID=7897 RepID=UPI00313A929E